MFIDWGLGVVVVIVMVGGVVVLSRSTVSIVVIR